ncbi:type 1 glutamine amidotransferase [Tranquillimonas rosea]|uniref:type 1 glutamine amidotransferase n=1 Tax=Tranquillimonas rosea TaxID=641238 RepID=UPI003BAC5468
MHIGILQTGHAPQAVLERDGDYDAMFARLFRGHDFDFTTWNVVDMEFPEGPSDAEGWLITGSRHGAYEDHPWIPPLEELIRAIHRSNRPLVGICFGHQIIAQALGGTVEKFGGGWSVGRRDYHWNGDTVHLNAWHQDQVIAPPPEAVTLAHNDSCAHAAFAIGDRIMTVQAHPEFTDSTVDTLIEHRGPGVVPDDRLATARAGLGAGVDSAGIADRLAAVLKGARP